MTNLPLIDLIIGVLLFAWSIDGVKKGYQTLKGDIYAWWRWFPYNVFKDLFNRVSRISPGKFPEKYSSSDPKLIRLIGYFFVIGGSLSVMISIMMIIFALDALYR